MAKHSKSPFSDPLRSAIAKSGIPLLVLERETGVKRQSIAKFLRCEQSLRLDMADKLAAYFGIECKSTKGKR